VKKLPIPNIIALAIVVSGSLVFGLLAGESNRSIAVWSGAAVSTFVAIFTYSMMVFTLVKSQKTFFVVFWSSIFFRMIFLFGAIFTAYYLIRTHIIAFVIALLSSYTIYLFAEVFRLSFFQEQRR
jgi:hypothetical protein